MKFYSFSTMSLQEIDYALYLTTVYNTIVYYTCLTVVNIGFASNILNILICLRKNIQKTTMGLYNIFMSVSNIMSFMFAYVLYFPESIGASDIILASYYSCILISFCARVFIQMSSWLNVMVSVDRTICISYPNKFNFIKDKKIITWIVLALFLLMCGLNVPNLYFSIGTQTIFISNETSNQTICGATYEIVLVKYTIIILMRVVLPIVLTVLSNVILIYKLFKSRKNLNITKSLNKDYQFAFTIIMLNFFFIITELPFVLGTMYMFVSNNEDLNYTISLIYFEQAKLVFISTFMFSTYMLGSIFFVNLIFNKIIQKEIKHIFFRNKTNPSSFVQTKSTVK